MHDMNYDVAEAEKVLAKVDPILGKLIARQKLEPLTPRVDYFASLCRSIVGQQVSVAAATAIFTRLEQATAMRPQKVLELDEEQVRTIGLSKQKASYIRDLAAHFARNPDVYNHLGEQSDELVIKELVEIKGIGVWTAQMFLMFTLGRPDVFAPDDLGLQNAIKKLYSLDVLPPKKELEKFAEKWAPYRTTASLHLWHYLSNTLRGIV